MSANAWGAMLKYHRTKAGLSQHGLADLINYTASHVASVETGRRNPSEDFVQRSDPATRADGSLIHLYETLKGQPGFKPGFEEWAGQEGEASLIRGYESVHVPGLLQTPEYARINLELDGEQAITAHLARQHIFDKDFPPVVRFVIDEWVLRRPVGDAGLMRRQLEHLEEMVTSGKVSVHVVRSGVLPGFGGGFSLATVSGRTIGCEETTTRTEVLTGEHHLHWLEVTWDRILAEAETPARSLELIRRTREELWTN